MDDLPSTACSERFMHLYPQHYDIIQLFWTSYRDGRLHDAATHLLSLFDIAQIMKEYMNERNNEFVTAAYQQGASLYDLSTNDLQVIDAIYRSFTTQLKAMHRTLKLVHSYGSNSIPSNRAFTDSENKTHSRFTSMNSPVRCNTR
jgi:hypothetical protein